MVAGGGPRHLAIRFVADDAFHIDQIEIEATADRCFDGSEHCDQFGRTHACGNLHDGGHVVGLAVKLADMVQRRNAFHLIAGDAVERHDRLAEPPFRIGGGAVHGDYGSTGSYRGFDPMLPASGL